MSRPVKPVHYAVISTSVVYASVLYLADLSLDPAFKQIIALLPALAGITLTVWDVILWRLPLIERLTKRPRLDGLWRAELYPTDESHIPPGGDRGPISAYILITQGYWSIAVRQYTAESKSDSRAVFWQRNSDAAVETLSFLYENNPAQRLEARSRRHLGSCTLDATSKAPRQMEGIYFTDRYTKGEMIMTLVDRTTGYSSFSAAKDHQPKSRRRQG